MMNFVPRDRLDLLNRWNECSIKLSPAQLALLEDIGRTPPDLYGNGNQFHNTPCAVTTTDGENIELAMISRQQHAPFEHWRICRLATDIAEIRSSPYALPLTVRLASAKADEMRMGFAPTLVDLPNGEAVALNWTQSFFVSAGIDASKITISNKRPNWNAPPRVVNGPEGIVYFVADL